MSKGVHWRLDGRKVSGLMVVRWIGRGNGKESSRNRLQGSNSIQCCETTTDF